MNLLLIVITIWITTPVFAQPPGVDDSIMAIKGKWVQGEAFIHNYDPALAPSEFGIIYKKLDSIATFFKTAYQVPLGAEAKWYPSISEPPLFPKGPSPYSFWSLYKLYYYNKSFKKITLGDETRTWAYVFVNSFNWLLNDTKLDLPGSLEKIWQLPRSLPEVWNKHVVYEAYTHGPNAKAIVITQNEKMPWKPVSRIQYLTALKNQKEEEYERMVADYDAGIENGRKKLEGIRNRKDIPAAAKQAMITAAQQQLDKNTGLREAMIKRIESSKNKDLQVIAEIIAQQPEKDLQQHAVINRHKNFLTHRRFEDPSSKDATWLVAIDKSYFDTTLPSYAPQFAVLYWRWNDVVPGLYFKKQFEANFPVDKLKAMFPANGKGLSNHPLSQQIRNEGTAILQTFIGQANNLNTWTAVKQKVSDLLSQKWKDGKLVSAAITQAFYIKADITTMTQNDINSGRLIVEVGFAKNKPAEFEVIRIVQQL